MKKNLLRITCFIVILVLCLGYINSIFKFKYSDGIYGVTKFYEQEDNTIDVLILGTSHAFEDFNTGVLWDEYGLSSYILAGSMQPMWNTYYYLNEALKTQTPDLIILEGYGTIYADDQIIDSVIIKNNYGLKWSTDKVNSLMTSSPRERWSEFFLEYSQYHMRYKELSEADFLKNQGNPIYKSWKGFGCNMAITPAVVSDVSDVNEREPLYSKTEQYYRAIIERAIDENIPIIVIVSPYAAINEHDQRVFNSASDIAGDYGVMFLNCNQHNDVIGMDWSVDAADTGHLSYKGNQKFSKYIGKYLVDNYSLPDHRGDPRYYSWEEGARFIRQMICDQELIECEELSMISEKMRNDNYWIIISVDGTCNTASPFFENLFDRYNIPKDGTNGIWYISSDCLWDTHMDDRELIISTASHDFSLSRVTDENGNISNDIIIDNVNYKKVKNGVNIVIYDKLTEKVVESVGFSADDEYAIKK